MVYDVFCSLVFTSIQTRHFRIQYYQQTRRYMSPVLFNVYIDDLSRTLHSMPFGCYINNTCVNHLVYADDMVLLAPSPRVLQGLIDTATKYFVDNGLMINREKD